MSINWDIMILPVMGALIGWITNVVAIKMLFWPKKAIRIPGIAWEFIGVLPKHRSELASSIGQAIDQSLLPMDEVLEHIENSGYQVHLVDAITEHIDERLKEILPRILPDNLKMKIRDYLKDQVIKESERLVGQVTHNTLDKIKANINLGVLVEEKIHTLDLDQLEALIKELSARELRHIELLGALLGLLVGLIQAVFVYLRFSA